MNEVQSTDLSSPTFEGEEMDFEVTTGYVQLVGPEVSLAECVFFYHVRGGPQERDVLEPLFFECSGWFVNLAVRDFGGHPDTAFRARASSLALVWSAGLLWFDALPLNVKVGPGIVWSK